jgi:hypothetical protein
MRVEARLSYLLMYINRRASAGGAQHCAGPNHDLTLVMTKERAMAEPNLLPLSCPVG